MITLVAALAVGLSASDLSWYFPITSRDKEIVADAIGRCSRKLDNAPDPMKGTIPIVMHFPNERCVELYLIRPALGGDPIYCYKAKNSTVTRIYDGFE